MAWWLRWLLWGVIWLVSGAVSFGVLEYMSWDAGQTLSYNMAQAPKYAVFVFGWLSGAFTAGLCIHFWWIWDGPKGHKKNDL
jgi:hypothetical protein